jgi:hypothetical protein
LRTKGDEGPDKEAIQELILDKKKEKKLKKERWEEEKKKGKGGKVEGDKDNSSAKDTLRKEKVDIGARTENHIL